MIAPKKAGTIKIEYAGKGNQYRMQQSFFHSANRQMNRAGMFVYEQQHHLSISPGHYRWNALIVIW
ncbi:hypothetical protein [Nitrosomonas ureae]|nr:hypothetical protein [Nitrosomonas ureae]